MGKELSDSDRVPMLTPVQTLSASTVDIRTGPRSNDEGGPLWCFASGVRDGTPMHYGKKAAAVCGEPWVLPLILTHKPKHCGDQS